MLTRSELSVNVPIDLNPESVAHWFFRLNGCATIKNFVVHPDQCGSQRTDVDVLAIRFPHRSELLTSDEPMQDHKVFDSDRKIVEDPGNLSFEAMIERMSSISQYPLQIRDIQWAYTAQHDYCLVVSHTAIIQWLKKIALRYPYERGQNVLFPLYR